MFIDHSRCLLFAQFVAWSRLVSTMSRERFSVSPGVSDGGADLSQFCDSCGRDKCKMDAGGFHIVIASSEAIQNPSAGTFWIASSLRSSQ
ncbi:hypothetical protein [Bradyrhizobium liaoningense]|uniref:hypothetical protein n=1 Tax=Bradyrhizobium liaoningense TaxID=43992 RepID=UPI001BA9B057|nr:hypothetical protein [Bradyrhizobium liaoningense]MBR0817754.1 hypothetical protein [Bradyrhizobium liaoningense]